MKKQPIIEKLKLQFKDLINYDSDDPLEEIDPITYRTPEGDTCLHIAALRGDLKAIKMLLQLGIDLNIQGDLGNTALHYAKRFGHDEIVKLLIENGALTDVVNELGAKALDD